MAFPFVKQLDEMDCGPSCVKMIAKHYGKEVSIDIIRKLSGTTRIGSNLKNLAEASEVLGFKTMSIKISIDNLIKDIPFPCIAHWNQSHFIVVYKTTKKHVFVSDPAWGKLKYSKSEFLHGWAGNETSGILLLFEPNSDFLISQNIFSNSNDIYSNNNFFKKYVIGYKKYIVQLIVGLIIASIFQLLLPFLNQSIIDVGIVSGNLEFIYIILIAQLMIFMGKTTIEVMRASLLLHISSRVSISIVSDFFQKLMKLPISFFDIKMTGDIMQRLNDHDRVERFLTSSTLNAIFSLITLIVFGGVLFYFNSAIFFIFFIGSFFYFAWVLFFLKYRAMLDFKKFQYNSKNQNKVLEIINGIQEIKLNNVEIQKRWQWEKIQLDLLKINTKSLNVEQVQITGSNIINEIKNIIITFLTAKLVIEGEISIGTMLSISFIVGQLYSPVAAIVSYIQNYQDAKLSFIRLNEIHKMKDEENNLYNDVGSLKYGGSITINNLSFSYERGTSNSILKNINLFIPSSKITAVVGASGSGKTTLMKMLLKFYKPQTGDITIDNINIEDISHKWWREKTSVVMQDGYLFSDTIANNIAMDESAIDIEKLNNAAAIAQIKNYINGLPHGYNTLIGTDGIRMSAGQKQRILIARAVYRNPEFIFFDEPTNSLDSENEKEIIDSMIDFFRGKTVFIIAHRLSTVKNADQIVVIDNGAVVELGKHDDLLKKKGKYYNLVNSQLEFTSN
jgi:ATP-binding cassette subfamily B protein